MTEPTPVEEQHAAFAQVGSTFYPALAAVFTALVIISNVTATKGVAFGPIITDGGFIVFPLTYVIGDVLSEVYGFKAARRVIFFTSLSAPAYSTSNSSSPFSWLSTIHTFAS